MNCLYTVVMCSLVSVIGVCVSARKTSSLRLALVNVSIWSSVTPRSVALGLTGIGVL